MLLRFSVAVSMLPGATCSNRGCYAAAAPCRGPWSRRRPQAVSSALGPPRAAAAPLGILLDYAAGVIRAGDMRAAGAVGAIRYVSDRRPGVPGCWQADPTARGPRPVSQRAEDRLLLPVRQAGHRGLAGRSERGRRHAKRGWQLHVAAGGSYGAPIYASIDDDPTPEQYKSRSRRICAAGKSVLGHQRVGVYANSKTIDWALQDGLGSYFWQHNWGSPKGFTHPGRPPAPGRDRQAQCRGRRRRHQPHSEAPVRAVGLSLTDQ